MKIISSECETIANLKYVKINKKNIDLSHFPDFMVVGPQRTGTTWLYKNLAGHPEIFLSKKKEIHFFNLLNIPDHSKYKTRDLSVYLKNFYDTPLTYFSKNLNCYIKYKQPYRPKMRGEASASYAAMEEEIVSEVATLNSNIKIILMIRNPIDRAWSHAKKDLIKRRRLTSMENLTKNELENYLRNKYQLACGNYTASIDKWSKYLLKGNLFIGFFDEIISAPEELLKKIYAFLGVSTNSKFIKLSDKKINSTNEEALPRIYRNMLQEIFKDEMKRLYTRYGVHWDNGE